MANFTAVGPALANALEARISSVLPSIPMRYRAEQSNISDYILVNEDDDRYAPEWSDKDSDGNDIVVVLEFWGSKPRTISANTKILVDSLNATSLTVSGFYHLRTVVEYNKGLPALTVEGQTKQYMRRLQIRFFYHPS